MEKHDEILDWIQFDILMAQRKVLDGETALLNVS